MKKSILTAATAAASAFAFAPAAQATIAVCQTPNCAAWDENVLVNPATAVPVVTGETNTTHAGINFTSPSAIGELLTGPGSGQARVEAADGLLNGLTFTLTNGNTFGSAVFNLDPLSGNQANEAVSVILTWILAGGGFDSKTLTISTNGQNDTGIYGTQGERLTSITFLANPVSTGINDLRQLRLGDVRGPDDGPPIPTSTAPEPATWATMLLGFAFVGAAMRRRKPHQAVRLTYA